AIVFPIVGAFFLFFGLLEDSGYLPRLSVMLDRIFRSFGLNGKAVLPMVLGLGCGTMAVLGSRILETKKERFLVIILLSLTIPCSAQLGVILGMLSGLSLKASILWFLSISGSLLLVGSLANKIVKGDQSPFILEIPPLRRPSIGNILSKVKMRVVWYVKEAVPLFMLGTAILFVADRTGLLSLLEKAASPVVVGLLGLPREATQSFLLGFLRRDYGAAGLFMLAKDGLLDPRQVLVSTVAITLLVPCIAQCFMVVREQGARIAAAVFLFVVAYALLFSGALNVAVKALHIL
ncbi:MAG: nucleoside recognition domain-containing protein, partial [Endomicrobiales bacterium]